MKKKKYIIYGIIILLVIISIGTFAWLTWRSRESNLSLIIGDENLSSVTLSPYQINTSISPSFTYNSNDYVSINADNNNDKPMVFDLYYEIDSSTDNELLTSSLKWNLLRSIDGGSNYSEYKNGNFATVTSNNRLVILKEDVPADTSYDYKLCIWLDGSNGNQETLSSKKLKASLKASLIYVDHTYLTTLGDGEYFKEADYISKIKTVSFVNYVNTNNALATYDLSLNQDNSVVGWIDSNYNLYIGSEWKIYSIDFSYAFKGMTSLTSIDFSNLDLRENTNLSYSFYNTSSLSSLDFSNFNTSNVVNMSHMFDYCVGLRSLNLSSFDTSNVVNMSYMFNYCLALRNLDISSFNTSKVTDMNHMFSYCFFMSSLDLSSFNTFLVNDMSYMFNSCSSLGIVYFNNANFSSVTNSSSMFSKNSVKVYVKDSAAKTFIENQGITSSNVIIS